ncbi:hypothetical protein MRB53_038351 [Persea americana]|nr:hypothetical protein MRB53_038351 [Persea americana]
MATQIPPANRFDSRTPRAATSQSGTGQTSKGAKSKSGKRGIQQSRAFCTKRCLLGLVNGGALDRDCANVNEHGTDVHRINKSTFLALMGAQLSQTLDSDFQPCERPGSRGVPFRATLASHGYTVIAKCTPADFVTHLWHEAAVYDRLQPIQGYCVPIHLGNLDLQLPYYYEGIAKLTHVMFLGYGGTPIYQHWHRLDQQGVLRQAEKCMNAIHGRDVLHRDVMPRNILWDRDRSEVMIIDFERAEMRRARPVLGQLSINRKRKSASDSPDAKRIGSISKLCAQEMEQLKEEMSCLGRTEVCTRQT